MKQNMVIAMALWAAMSGWANAQSVPPDQPGRTAWFPEPYAHMWPVQDNPINYLVGCVHTNGAHWKFVPQAADDADPRGGVAFPAGEAPILARLRPRISTTCPASP